VDVVTPGAPIQAARGTAFVVGVAVFLAAVSLMVLVPLLADLPILAALAALAVYLFSNVLRGLRIAILSIDLLGVSGRTAALMHLVTAPVALVMPFKSGEILRWHQLWRLSGSGIYALIALLIERMFDSLFLVPVLVMLLALGSAPVALTVLTLLAASVPLIVLVVGPKLLTETQRYVVVNHDAKGALRLLRHVDALRLLVARAALVARNRAPELGLLSCLIWLCEIAVCAILVHAVAGAGPGLGERAMELMGLRLVAPVWSLEASALLGAAMATTFVALLSPWPVVVLIYQLRRHRDEPDRLSTLWRAETEARP
jgi:hypothetical protein